MSSIFRKIFFGIQKISSVTHLLEATSEFRTVAIFVIVDSCEIFYRPPNRVFRHSYVLSVPHATCFVHNGFVTYRNQTGSLIFIQRVPIFFFAFYNDCNHMFRKSVTSHAYLLSAVDFPPQKSVRSPRCHDRL
jgi:hypothetical protein